MKILYFDCYAGISGDMILGALIELGVDLSWLVKQLQSIPLEGINIQSRTVKRGALSGTKIEIQLTDSTKQRRSLNDFIELIKNSPLPQDICEPAIDIFHTIANAEAKIHRENITNIHFHELGSIDSLIDIVGTLLAIKALAIDKIFSSPLHLGTGLISTEHGTIPVPAPATLEILKAKPVFSTGRPHELVTPTGAALITSLASQFGPLPSCEVDKIGYGAGTRNPQQFPNLLRVILGKTTPDWRMEKIVVMETDIDDMNPEYYEHIISQLFLEGALDVSLSSIIMKKNRPASKLTIISQPSCIDKLSSIVFQETSTFGIRINEIWRRSLNRESISVSLPSGDVVRVKIGKLDNKIISASPEYEDCRKIATKIGKPIKEIYQEIYRLIPTKYRA